MGFQQSRGRAGRAAHLAALLGTSCIIAIAASGAALAQSEPNSQTQTQSDSQRGKVAQAQQSRPLQQIAQNQPAPVVTAQAAPGAPVPEQVLITGSLIGGTPAVGVPVNTLSQQSFIETGALTIPDILKSVPALHIDAQASPTYGGGSAQLRTERPNSRSWHWVGRRNPPAHQWPSLPAAKL